jgi:general secretion pathway protein A
MHDKFWRTRPEPSGFPGGASASLTYEPFYGLREKAFSLAADPRFLFRSSAHAPAFDALLAGIRRREGLIVLTGEIGTGKTMLCKSVLQHLDRRTFAAFVPDPFVSREDLLRTLLVDFGVISVTDLRSGRFHGASRSDLSFLLYEFLDSLVPLQAFAVLVIDEAQNLALPLLEEIRILSELERREKLLQVVLVGQPELRSSLKLTQMRQVDQRVSVRCELAALDAEGTAGYVNHRLAVAGPGDSRLEFTPAALEAVHEGSSGVPRLINRVCDRALARAYVSGSMRIEEEFVRSALDDLGLTPIPDVQSRPTDEQTAVSGGERRPAAEAPILSPAPESPVFMSTDTEVAAALADFAPEASIGRAVTRQAWVAGILASLAFAASAAGVGWYLRAQTIQANLQAPLLPPRPRVMFARPLIALPAPEPALRGSSSAVNAVRAASGVPAEAVGYDIVVASFESRARAERLVEELKSAGYRARAVEHDWGPPRGRLVQVNVGGYVSAIEVQRDLQRIRELPGGYGDARIVERE